MWDRLQGWAAEMLREQRGWNTKVEKEGKQDGVYNWAKQRGGEREWEEWYKEGIGEGVNEMNRRHK